MKYWILFFGLFICSSVLYAQEQHYIYIQTENGKPFYIKFRGNVISSSAAGYVIIPQLERGAYQINIGFPRNEFPEEAFHVTLNGSDLGFLLKNFGDKGWSLFNLQSMDLIAGASAAPQQTLPQQQVPNNAFTMLLADVVQDSSLLLDNTPLTTAVTPEKKDTALKKDTTIQKDLVMQQEIPVWNNDPVPNPQEKEALKEQILPGEKQLHRDKTNTNAPDQGIMKIMSMYDVDGMEFIYLDKALNDTIRIFLPSGSGIRHVEQDRTAYPPEEQPGKEIASMPAPKTGGVLDEMEKENVVKKVKNTKEPVSKIIYEPSNPDQDNLTITPTILTPEDLKKVSSKEKRTENKPSPAEKSTNKRLSRIIYEPEPTGNIEPNEPEADRMNEDVVDGNHMTVEKIPMVLTSSDNKNCKNFATHKDFLELRKKMAGEMEMEKMLDVARADLRNRCYTTEQVKNLSYLFLADEGKYRFYDMAYRHVSDQERFYILEQQLKDAYYINRFKAMITK